MNFDYGVFEELSKTEDVKEKFYSLLGYGEDDMEDEAVEYSELDYSHVEELDDGCGCAEVWEELSEQRSELSPEELDD